MKNVVQFLWSKPAPRDWTNQDLADFYRVESALVQAGLSIETERGLSDEGEPWFAFCHADTQEVVVHCARIDGLYVVASAAFEGILRGPDFRTVVEGVLERHPLVMPRQKEGGGNVRFHPSALLVALVATAFFKLSGEAQAHDGTVDFDISASGSRFDFSALKHLLIDLDKRQAALIVAAMVYVHSDMGVGTLVDHGFAKADVLSDDSANLQVVQADGVDQLFEQFVGQNVLVDDSERSDQPVTVLGLTESQELTSWSLASFSEDTAQDARELDAKAAAVADAQFATAAEYGSTLAPTAVMARADIDTALTIIAVVQERSETSSGSGSSLSRAAEAGHSASAGEAQKFVQSLISEFSTGAFGVQLSETSKGQVVAALTSVTEPAQVVPATVVAPQAPIQFDPVVSAPMEILTGNILQEIKGFYDPSKLSETIKTVDAKVQDMVKNFVLGTLDFQTVTSGKNIVLYDPTPTGFHDEKFVTVVFDDKSTISLIGTFDILATTV